MKLKKIEILGFKSFADRVSLNFDQGITCIVGPNGCGKSNISDAFRWVLGEQSAKSLRGGKMQDVVFAGTASRKPLNFAEVTITMDNEDGSLPIEYSEVAVTRRLHRNGDSDYFINKQPVRLKDVQNLFLDSGMGKDAYSIFEQGKIDQVINFTPLERRYIFEEAAGILRFLQRKREALRKLELSDQNISRVKDIHQEVEKQIIILEKQAEKAREYKENRSKLEFLEKGLFLAKWEHLQKKTQDQSRKGETLQSQLESEQQQLVLLQEELQKAKDHLAEGEKELRAKSEEVFKSRSDKEIKSKERYSQHERFKEVTAKETKWQQELDLMRDRRQKRKSEIDQLQKQQQSLEAEIKVFEGSLQQQRSNVQNVEGQLTKLRMSQQALQQELIQFVQAEKQAESELKQTSLRLEQGNERKNQLTEKRKRLIVQIDELEKLIKEKQKNADEISNEIDERKQGFNKLEKEEQIATTELQTAQKRFEEINKEWTEGRARHMVLKKLRDEMEGFSAGSKRLLHESGNPKSPLYNKVRGLYEFIQPKPGAEVAVMRTYTQTLVVENNEDLELVSAFASKNKIKDYSLFSLEYAGKKSVSDHFLENIQNIESLAELWKKGKSKSGEEIWISEGAFMDRRAVLFFAPQSEQNVFIREAELKLLDSKLKECEDAKITQEQLLKDLQKKKSTIYTERLELDKIIRKLEMKLIELNFGLQRQNGDLERFKSEVKQIESETKQVEESVKSHSIQLKEMQANHVEAKTRAAEKQANSAQIHADLERQASALKGEQSQLQQKESSYHKLSEELRKTLHALHVIDVKDVESQQQEKRLEDEIQTCRELQTTIKIKGGDLDKLLNEAETLLQKVMAACTSFDKEVAQRKIAIEKWEAKLQEQRNKIKKIEDEIHQTALQGAHTTSSIESIHTELQERFNLTIAELQKSGFGLDKSIDQAERQVRALRQELEAAGDVNMTSIEDFDKQKERYQFLNTQIEDMNLSKHELVEIIAQLDGESRKIFQETFDKVRSNFKKNFQILFNGGEADLEFTDTQDVLEAGIEIIARPPGKQMRSINLMSGGEKCLTAMALLFAIFEVKPAPYCILDEIDAPLDDTNVERFVNVVKQFINRCQFVIITHNKRTMAIADVLFGVSMEEKGVSKILSLEFAKI